MFIIQISELLLKNNNEEVSLVIQKEKQILFDLFTRGFHAYMKILTSKIAVCIQNGKMPTNITDML